MYDPSLIEPLVNVIKALSNYSSKILFALTERRPETLQLFFDQLEKENMIIEFISYQMTDVFFSSKSTGTVKLISIKPGLSS